MMKRGLAAFLTGIMTVTLMAAGLTGCGSNTADKETEKVRLMVWSPSEDQSKDSGEWLQTMCNNFAKEHPEWNITFVYGVADEASAADQVAQDPEASADVFMYANDRITSLTDADAVAKLGGKYKEEIESTNSEELLDSLKVDGELYGVPFTTNTWYMFYDKSVFSEEDVKNLDTMLQKGTVSFPFTNSWYLPAFYLGNGCTLFGDGTDESKGVDFAGEKAVDATNYAIDLAANPNFIIDADGSALAGLRDGSVKAMFTGSWDANAIKEALGDNMGVTSLPTYTINGEEKQMLAYAGSKAIGVNAHVDLMNRIRSELDQRYGKGKKIIYGEPWAADKTAVEGDKKLATKENIGLLDENIGAFCDSTRDGIKGSALRAKEAGFINGAEEKEDEMLASVAAWCTNPYHAEGFENVKAPSQIVTYVSAHDNHTLWNKLKETVVEEKECMRLNKMAAAVYMTCQGTLFFLSGEEFARTKDGLDNTFKAPISLNRLDWKKAWKNHELVHYYQGLIALRKQISGLCDKSKESSKRIINMWKEKDVVGFTVVNDEAARWSQVKIIYNARKSSYKEEFLDDGWEVLSDADDSWCWKKGICVDRQIEVAPQSVLILGRK